MRWACDARWWVDSSSIRAEPRLTRDADLAVSVGNDGEAEALILSLSQRGHRVLAVVEDDRTGRRPQRVSPTSTPIALS